MKKDFDHTAASGAAYTQKGYDQLISNAREQFEKAGASALKAYEDLIKFQRENYEAFVTSTTIFAKGVETVGKVWSDLAHESWENFAQTTKALLGAKTLREAVEVQSDFAKVSFDKLVAESTKLSEMTVKVANEAFQPINARLNVAVERLLKPIAA
ncbi:MAG TPA: phasin family protein [Alphaproteobacteria bacterium]